MSNAGDALQEVFEATFDAKDEQNFYSQIGAFDSSNAINSPHTLSESVSPQPSLSLSHNQADSSSSDRPNVTMDFLSAQDFRFGAFDDPTSFLTSPYDSQAATSEFLLPVQNSGHQRAHSYSSDTSAPSPQYHSPYAASPVNPDDYSAEMAGLSELTYDIDLNGNVVRHGNSVPMSQQPQGNDMVMNPMNMDMGGMGNQIRNNGQMNQMNQMHQMAGINQMNQHNGQLNPPIQLNQSMSQSDISDIMLPTSGSSALSPSLLTPNMLSPSSQSHSSSPQTSQGSVSSHQSIPMLSVEPPREDNRRRAHSDASQYSDSFDSSSRRSVTPGYDVPTLFPHANSPSQISDPADLLSPGDAVQIQTERSRSRSSSTSSVRSRDASRSPSRSPSTGRSRSNSSHSRDYILELAAPTTNNKRVQKHPSTFACHLCDKRFTRSYNLRSHLRTHTDERPFVCTVCGKAFARQHDRKRHEALHSGEKKYQCQGMLADGVTPWGCGRKFARADALGRHFKTEAGRECIRLLLEEEANEKQVLSGQQVAYSGDGVPSLTFSPPAEAERELRAQQPVIFPAALLQKYPVLLNHLNED